MAVRRWLLGWVLVALLVTQALGLVHRVVHGLGTPTGDAHAQEWTQPEPAAAAPGEGWLHALFAAHKGYSGCLSFDAVGHGGLAPPAVLGAPVLPPAQECAPPVRTAFADFRAAAFQARAPPVSR